MSSRRIDRINGLLREEISQLLSREIKDPRLNGIISITQVKTSNDLRNAIVFVSVMGDDATKQEALAGIQSAATFMRRELRERLSLRYVPFMKFRLDESIEDADHVLRIMDQIKDDRTRVRPEDAGSAYRGPLTFPSRGG
jgi:ribosome-binding factor A